MRSTESENTAGICTQVGSIASARRRCRVRARRTGRRVPRTRVAKSGRCKRGGEGREGRGGRHHRARSGEG
eukprot:6866502-Alexandrium_andersonii.AAC.1